MSPLFRRCVTDTPAARSVTVASVFLVVTTNVRSSQEGGCPRRGIRMGRVGGVVSWGVGTLWGSGVAIEEIVGTRLGHWVMNNRINYFCTKQTKL